MIKEFGEDYSLSFENHSTIYRFYISVYSPQVIEVNGPAPLVVVVGPPVCGKGTAYKLALATTGSYPGNFFTLFTDKGNGDVSSKTSIGFVADDPNEPKDVGDASNRYHDSGKEKSFHLERTACCGPIFSVNEPVLRWLQDPDRRRYAMVF